MYIVIVTAGDENKIEIHVYFCTCAHSTKRLGFWTVDSMSRSDGLKLFTVATFVKYQGREGS